MKFKFADEVQKVIDQLAALPAPIDDVDATRIPLKTMAEISYIWGKRRIDKKLSTSDWVKYRRQLGFLYSVVDLVQRLYADKMATDLIAAASKGETFTKPTDDQKRIIEYNVLIKFINDVKTGEALKELSMIRNGLKFGVIYLSNHEIEGLIERNKV